MRAKSTSTKKTTSKSTSTKTASKPATKSDFKPSNLKDANVVFALDIGTRSVVGVLGVNEGSQFKVFDFEQRFHAERAMRDGQIENIELVSNIVHDVKESLEKRNGIELKKVCIAAAGRTLKTKKVSYEQELDPTTEINHKLVQAIEYCALGLAQSEFDNDEKTDGESLSFYCVGYSVTGYKLDDYSMDSLIGHRGKNASVELIAAFLPQNVVQSLYSVTAMNDLTVENLTLEPIAAINVIVPKDIRLLNIALVDIGAGTSDIAISKNGTVTAYDMVTTAGDEITESIMQEYLTNFETAENIKISLDCEGEDVEFSDILGNVRKVKKARVLKSIRPAIKTLSKSISDRIIEINGSAPSAMFLVGGGSLTPELTQMLAQELKMPPYNIAIGGNLPYKDIKVFTDKLQNPEFITPLGIGALSSLYKGCDFFAISVNGKKIMLLNNGECKVIDALLLAGIKPQSLIGISSRAITYYLNGEKITKRGKSADPGELFINNQPASIDTKIKHGDEISVKPAVDGEQPTIKIKDIRKEAEHLKFILDDTNIDIAPAIYKNGKKLSDNYIIKPFDEFTTDTALNISEIFEYMDYDLDLKDVNFTVNGEAANVDTLIENGSVIMTSEYTEKTETAKLSKTEAESDIQNNDSTNISDSQCDDNQDDENENENNKNEYAPDGYIMVCINGNWERIDIKDKNKILFFDMLNYVDIDPQNPQGNIILKLNGDDASYTSVVNDGDGVEIRWDTDTK